MRAAVEMPDSDLPSIAFASCNRPYVDQSYWTQIAAEHPSHFFWIGDAVYTKSPLISKLHDAYDLQLSHPEYKSFVKNVHVDGVWDDHDYGINDGGRDVPQRSERQSEFLRFLRQSGNQDLSALDGQDGVYHSIDVPFRGHSMKVIFLDTRSFRSSNYIRSLAEQRFPLSAIVASAIRGAYSVMGFGRKYDADMLGQQQWAWLERTLQDSRADLTVIVSSVQVLTSNPVFESWGHFPTERQRLLDLIGQHNPKRTLLLSGDVHLGELSVASYQHGGQLLEVTSSGLTHTGTDNPINAALCPLMMNMFHRHRETKQAFFTGKNYGTIQLAPIGSDGFNVTIAVKSLEPGTLGEVQLSRSILLTEETIAVAAAGDVKFADFPVLPAGLQIAVYFTIFTVLAVLVKWIRSCMGLRTARAPKRKKA